jgi:glycosyltransferase involved in cell wall biosynthesis
MPAGRPAVLIWNAHLPVFPGGGGVEALTTRQLARLADSVGLVSLAYTPEDLRAAQALADEGVRLFLWRAPGLVPDHDEPPPTTSATHTHDRPAWRSRLGRAATRARAGLRWLSRRPTDTWAWETARAHTAVTLWGALEERPWSVVSVVESSAACVLDVLPYAAVRVLNLHDVRARLYARRAKATGNPWRRLLWSWQARRYERHERRACQVVDLVTTVSETDAEWVRAHYAPRELACVPLPIDAAYFAPCPDVEEPGTIVLTGLMSHAPNADAAAFFAQAVLPRVRAQVPEARFVVVGRAPDREVLALARLPGVEVTGAVPDVRPYLARATVVVAPLRFGSGARQKILEAWAMDKCVVATSIGAEGLTTTSEPALLVADGAPALAQAVTTALTDAALRARLRGAGRAHVLAHHDPRQVAAGLYARLASTAQRRRAAERPLRALIDLRWMAPGLAGGLETVGRALLDELAQGADAQARFTVLAPAAVAAEWGARSPHLRFTSRDDLRALGALGMRGARAVGARLGLVPPEPDALVRLRRLHALEAEVAYALPGYIHPDVQPLPHVLLVPDVQHEYHPEFFSAAALEERRRLFGAALRRARRVLAISEFTRRTLIERLGLPSERVGLAPLAAGPAFGAQPAPGDPRRLQRLGLEAGGYLLFPGHTWRHKDHASALDALRVLRDRHGLRLPLVCPGGAREAQAELVAQSERAGLTGQVLFPGHVPVATLAALYRGAAALVFPSLFEGFGMPVLEAMVSGCPVVCTDGTALVEVAGPAALRVPPRAPEALAEAVARLLREPALRAEQVARGHIQAQRFTWQAHAQAVLEALRAVQDDAGAEPTGTPEARAERAPTVTCTPQTTRRSRRGRLLAALLQRRSAGAPASRTWTGAALALVAPGVWLNACVAPAWHARLARLLEWRRSARARAQQP